MRLSSRGVTLLELMFVCGLFLVVLTVLTMSLRQTAMSQNQLDKGSEAMVNLELSRLKLSGLLRRSELGGPLEYHTPVSELTLRLYEMNDGRPGLNAQGEPMLGEVGTLVLEEGNLLVTGMSEPYLVSRLGEGAKLEITRISESRFRFRLQASDGQKEPREMVFEAGFGP